jgi:hypothetical protein
MWRANIFAVFMFVLWVGLLWFDIGLMQNMAHYQHQWGYPNAADINQYIVVPAAILVLLFAVIIIFNFFARSARTLTVFACISIVPFLYILMIAAAAAI